MKKILLLADIHQKYNLLSLIDKFLNKHTVDLVVFLGDLTDRNDNALIYAQDFYSLLKKHKVKLFYIHGNNEPKEVVDFFNKKNCSIHNILRKFNGINFIGIGGWGDEIKIETLSHVKNSFFVTHVPPIKSSMSKDFINAPLVHAFGHSHRNEYVKLGGKTIYISLKAAAFYKRCALIEIPSYKVNFLDL